MTHTDQALVEAVDGLIGHAVEWAGLRLRRSLPRRYRAAANQIPPSTVHIRIRVDRDLVDRRRILDGAFARLPAVADRFNLDPACLEQTLADYVRDLLVAGQPHHFTHTRQVLRAACLNQETADV